MQRITFSTRSGPEPSAATGRAFADRMLERLAGKPVAACLFVAGPGSGKTHAAELIAAHWARPIRRWHAPGGMPLDLTAELGIPAEADPERLARLLFEGLRRQYPEGAVLIADAVESLLDDPAGSSFLDHCLRHATASHPIFVTSRRDLPFSLMRRVARGEVVLFGVEHLWLRPGEVADLLAGLAPPAEVCAELAGWPLGVRGIMEIAADPRLSRLALELVAEELIAPLPPGLRSCAMELSLLPRLNHQLAELLLPKSPVEEVLERLSLWGLLHAHPEGGLTWHPLSRRALRSAWLAEVPASGRTERLEEVAAALAECDPEGFVAVLVGDGAWELAAKTLRLWQQYLVDAPRMEAYLALFPADFASRSPDLAVIESVLARSRGAVGDAIALADSALLSFRAAGNRAGECDAMLTAFAAQLEREDAQACREWLPVLAALEPGLDLRRRVWYLLLKGIHHHMAGNVPEAQAAFQEVLRFPHLGDRAIVMIQHRAADSLAYIMQTFGEYGEAERYFRQAIHLADASGHSSREWPRIYLGAMYVTLGNMRGAARLIHELRTAPSISVPAASRSSLMLLMLECEYLMQVDRPDEAADKCNEALTIAALLGHADTPTAWRLYHLMAAARRRQKEFAAALAFHAKAGVFKMPYHQALGQIQWGVTLIAADQLEAAQAKLKEAEHLVREAGPSGPELASELSMVQAALHVRCGRMGEAIQAFAPCLDTLRRHARYFPLVSHPELAGDLWRLLLAAGHQDIVQKLESLYPQQAAAARKSLEATLPASPRLGPARPPVIEIRCLGPLEVVIAGQPPFTWPRKRAKALLAHLLNAPGGLGRAEVIDRLFPDAEEDSAQARLDQLVLSLRKQFEPQLARGAQSRYVRHQDQRYRLEREGIWADVVAFEAAYDEGMRAWHAGSAAESAVAFERALELYRGDLFGDPDLLDWFEQERFQIRSKALEMLDRLMERYGESDEPERGREAAERCLAIDPTNEAAHRWLMELYGRFGKRDLVRRQYQACARMLRAELEVDPAPETQALFRRLVSNQAIE